MSHCFTFRKPGFIRFDYVPVVIENEAYCLFSWELKHACRLRIEALHFTSHSLKGSAYARIDSLSAVFKVRVSNWFRTSRLILPVVTLGGGQFSYQAEVLPLEPPVIAGIQKEIIAFRPVLTSFTPKVIEFSLPD